MPIQRSRGKRLCKSANLGDYLSKPTPLQSLLSMLIDPDSKKPLEWSALAKALLERRVKVEEKEKVGDMLVEFFESEMAVDDLIVTALTVTPGSLQKSKESLLPFIPARRKMDFLKENGIISKKISGLFQKLHDERNKLAHPQGRRNRPGKVVTDSARNKFINECSIVLNAIYKAHIGIYEKEKRREKDLKKKAAIMALSQLSTAPNKKMNDPE